MIGNSDEGSDYPAHAMSHRWSERMFVAACFELSDAPNRGSVVPSYHTER